MELRHAGHQVVPDSSSTKPDASVALIELDEGADDTNRMRPVYSRRVESKNRNFRIEWSDIFSNAVLEATQSIGLPWESVTTTATNQVCRWMVLQPMIGTARFFRLRVQ